MCYENWAPGNGTEVEDCSGGERAGAVQSGSKQWVSLPENKRLNFICTIKTLWTLSFCWTHQFHVVEETKTWTDAQKHCREKFTDLATTENQEDMNAVKAVLNGTADNPWIGLRQKNKTDVSNYVH
ncbi:hypothetical protein MHYP_G00015060 [Metynnis hypsauchen]